MYDINVCDKYYWHKNKMAENMAGLSMRFFKIWALRSHFLIGQSQTNIAEHKKSGLSMYDTNVCVKYN